MSIDVFAIALKRSGLCWEIRAPTRRPFAQKLSVRITQHSVKRKEPTPYSSHGRLSSVFTIVIHPRDDSLCRRALSNCIPSSFSTSRLIILVKAGMLRATIVSITLSNTEGLNETTNKDYHKRSWRKSRLKRDANHWLRKISHKQAMSHENKSCREGFGGCRQSTGSALANVHLKRPL